MKKLYTLLSLCLVLTTSYGQTQDAEKADKLFDSYQYVDAIDAYLKLVENQKADHHVYKQLADSYYNVFNTKDAAKWYAKAVEVSQDAETYYRYSQALKSQGNYELANEQMDVFSKLTPNDQRAINHLKNPNYVPKLADKTKLFDFEETSINSNDQSDFGSILSNDNILYFVSSRKSSNKEDSWTKKPYLDIYKSVRNSEGELSEPEPVKGLNTPYHDGPITLSADGNTIIFARDGHSGGYYKKVKKNKVKLGQQGLYIANRVNGEWKNIQPLPFNSKEYSVSHPSLSADGKTLYFSSNMPGGLGDTDIWKVSINNNQYGTPENLGPKVNTAGKEGFPFISENNILYFASSGKQGFGGYDVFKANLTENEEAVNLGKPINTKSDDFSFSINTSENVGYFSSNRSGVDNIYAAIPVCKIEVITTVKNAKTHAVIANASVSILDDQHNNIATQQTVSDGTTSFTVNCDMTYVLSIEKEGYESVILPVEHLKGGLVEVEALLVPINKMITDTEVKLNNVYFEFNKSNITKLGASELDKLVAIMHENLKMHILVKSHTDTKGSAAYNLKLSERRAQATMQYLISKGIDKSRLSAKGMGSTTPKVDCKSNCTAEDDAENRRSEFLIVK